MAPMLWNSFATDLVPSGTRLMSVLLDPKNGILPHIRFLQLRGQSTASMDTVEADLRLLIDALPKNSLTGFASPNTAITDHTLLLILQSHSSIQTLKLKFRSTEQDKSSLEYRCWLLSMLKRVETLTLMPTDEDQYDALHHLIESSHKLQHLEIRGGGVDSATTDPN
jgi:hypothetical protein